MLVSRGAMGARLRGREQRHARTQGRFRQSVVLGRKRNAVAHGKFEIAGVTSAQPLAASQFEYGAQHVVGRLLVDHDWKPRGQALIAFQIAAEVAGPAKSVTPSGASASRMAFVMAGKAAMAPASPQPLTPSGLVVQRV